MIGDPYSRRTRVYVAGPITGPKENKDRYPTIVANLRAAFDVGQQLMQLGYAPFIPQYSHYWALHYDVPYQTWLDYDKSYILTMDALLRIPGGSEGADMEVRWAWENLIPIFYSIQDLVNQIPSTHVHYPSLGRYTYPPEKV